MHEKADSKRKQRAAFAAIAGFVLLASAGATFAQGMDATDRQDKMDINREDAETRIERMHQDQERRRSQQKKTTKKSHKTLNKRQQRMQF
jgi:hypothetical protein